MKLSYENHVASVLKSTPEEYRWLKDYLSITEPIFRKNYTTRKIEYKGVQQNTFLNKYTHTFPAGFVRLIQKAAATDTEIGPIPVEIVDRRNPPQVIPLTPDLSYLRDYQQDAVSAALKAKRGILHLPTGSGKTMCAMALIQTLPIRWIFLVQSKDLLHQTAAVYQKVTGKSCGIIGDGIVNLVEGNHLVVAMIQTLHARKGDDTIWPILENAEGLVVDEAHTTASPTLQKLTSATKNAFYRYGLSATPLDRSDQRSMLTIGALGPIIYRIRTDVLIDQGWLSKPTITMYRCPQTSNKATYKGAYTELIVKSPTRNQLVVDIMRQANDCGFVFVQAIDHGKELLKRARKAGINCEFVWGDRITPERQAAVERLIRSDLQFIIASSIFYQSIDVPELASIIIATGGKSVIQTLQRLGRGLRITETKKSVQVFDIFDEDDHWLEKHSRNRKRSYEKEGHTVVVQSFPSLVR